jgi:hypothetical protein
MVKGEVVGQKMVEPQTLEKASLVLLLNTDL